MAQHIFVGSGAPTTAPTNVGHHYIDTQNGISYISVGIMSSADWKITNPLVASVAGKIGDVLLDKSDVGLDQVDNTSDLDKPVSTDQATAIATAESNANGYTDTAITNHEAAANPHPQYLEESEANALYDAIGSAAAAQAFAIQRANHTGTQLASTISDFNEAAQDAVGTALTDTGSVDLNYNDGLNQISASVIYGTPVSQAPDQSNSSGSSDTAARSDHVHNIPAGNVLSIGTANAKGSAASFALSDHIHNHGSQTNPTHHAVATISASGFMSSGDKTKLDGVATGATNTPLASTAPANVTKAAAVIGVSTTAARADHKHDITTAAPVSIGDANAEGISTSLARADHVHDVFPIFFFQNVNTVGTTTNGTATLTSAQSLTTPSLPAGTYRIGWYCELTLSNTTNDWLGTVTVSGIGTVGDVNIELSDATTWQQWSGFYYATTSGVVTINLNFAVEAGVGTASIRRRRLEIWRVE